MTETVTMTIDPTNEAAAQAWDGIDGEHWVEWDHVYDRSVARYNEPLLDAAGIGRGERVLDVGCGSGSIACAAARAVVDGSVLGVDLSTGLLDLARRRAKAEGVMNVEFIRTDAQAHHFELGRFDIAVSRTGAMFFGDPFAGFCNIARALRLGGRLALLTWQPVSDNGWLLAIRKALALGRELPEPTAYSGPGPFSLSDPDRVRDVLTSAGFGDLDVAGHSEPMWFGGDGDEAFAFLSTVGVVKGMLTGVDEAGQAEALALLRRSIDAHLTTDGVVYPSATWVITAIRRADRGTPTA
jgi:SAM-dependent methyltransferase